MPKATLPPRAAPNCRVHCRRNSANEQSAYNTRQVVVESKIMNVNTLTMDFWYFARISSVANALPKHRPNPGVLCTDSRAKIRGNSPRFAIARGSSPCSRIHPFNAPNALIAANTATSFPAPLPQNCAAKSTNGALDRASVAGGTSSKTVVHAMAQISAVIIVPSSVAMGMVRAGLATLSAGMVAAYSPRSAQSVNVAAAVTPLTESGILSVDTALLECKDVSPSAPTASSGSIFNTVVTP